jgi:hypothetical protein
LADHSHGLGRGQARTTRGAAQSAQQLTSATESGR